MASAAGEALGGAATQGPQHMATLSSIEDDGLGEELRVVWELEPGARIYEAASLPPPTDFDAA